MKKSIILLAFTSLMLTSHAQEVNTQKEENAEKQLQRSIPSPEKNAKRITNLMKRELDIDDKQYKKLYKINLEAQKEVFSQRSMGPGGPRPTNGERPQGMPEGMGGAPGGMGGGPGGMGGGPNGMSGGPRGMGGGPGGMGPGGFGGGSSYSAKTLTKEQMEKNRSKREAKIKKVIGEEKYAKWVEVEKAERENMMKRHQEMGPKK